MTEVKDGVEEEEVIAPEPQDGVEEEDQNAPADQEPVVDYKAELEKMTSERDNYKQGMINAKDKLKKQKDDDFDLFEEDTEVSKELEILKETVRQNSIDGVLSSLSSNPDEQQLILAHYKNSLKPSGTDAVSIRKDLERAKILANNVTFAKENKELKAILKAKTTTTSSSRGANQSKDRQASAAEREKKAQFTQAQNSGDLKDWTAVVAERLKK